MTDLVRKQIVFVHYLGHLFDKFCTTNITVGEFWRSDETCAMYAKAGKGIRFSLHQLRLAADLQLRKLDGRESNDREDYLPLGEYWKSLPKLYPADIPIVTCWGGDFKSLKDIYHFSIEHGGVR